MTLQELCDTLPEEKKVKLVLTFTRMALPVWEKYANENELCYRDSVVGMEHTVDALLLERTIEAAERHFDTGAPDSAKDHGLRELDEAFTDPIVSLQDLDWELPYAVERTFYAVYNLLNICLGEKVSAFGESMWYVCLNQAIDAIERSGLSGWDNINSLLEKITGQTTDAHRQKG